MNQSLKMRRIKRFRWVIGVSLVMLSAYNAGLWAGLIPWPARWARIVVAFSILGLWLLYLLVLRLL
jgi:hypothetical protein